MSFSPKLSSSLNKSLLPDGITGKFKKSDVEWAMKCCAVSGTELDTFVQALSGSKKRFIIAGDAYLRSDTGLVFLRALWDLPFLMGKQSTCRIVIPTWEGSLHAGILAGVHPDLLPGFQAVSNGKTLRQWNIIRI